MKIYLSGIKISNTIGEKKGKLKKIKLYTVKLVFRAEN